MSAIYFILLLGGLILIHELGHFLVAKAMGVKVLVFSIGFGPALVRWSRGDTEYRIAAVPLGGFVKMFGDEAGEQYPPRAEDERAGTGESTGAPPAAGTGSAGAGATKIYGVTAGRFVIVDADKAFNSKPLWRRALIVLAGPVSNLLLPFLVFFGLAMMQTEATPAYIGAVEEDGPAWDAGIRPGDEIVAIEGDPIRYWWEMEDRINASAGKEMQVDVRRRDRTFSTAVTPEEIEISRYGTLDLVDREGRILVLSNALLPIVAIRPGSPAAAAGLRTHDRVLAVDGTRVRYFSDLVAALTPDGEHGLEVVREKPVGLLGHALFSVYDARFTVSVPGGAAAADIRSAEMEVHAVAADSPAAKLGLRAGDRIVSIDGRKFPLWMLVEGALAEDPAATHEVIWEQPDGTVRKGALALAPKTVKGEFNEDRQVVVFGASNHSAYTYPEPVPNESLLAFSVSTMWQNTRDAYRVTLAGIAGLLVGKVPIRDMGGPILIYSMASKTEEKGWEYFFFVMAWLSISLGVINLFPIPILDGGHLLFFAIEGVIRRPVPLRLRQAGQWVGLALIVLLMVVVMRNDIMRNWDTISNWF